MKKQTIGLLFFLLALSVLLSGCGEKNKDNGGNPNLEVPLLTVFADGVTEFVIVRPDDASEAVVDAAIALYTAFRENCGVPIRLYDESAFAYAEEERRIVVGITGDALCRTLRETLLYDDFIFHIQDGTLYIIGGSDHATAEAVTYFAEEYLMHNQTGKLQLAGDLDRLLKYDYDLPALSIAGIPVRNYTVVYDADLYWSCDLAQKVRDLIRDKTGYVLNVVADDRAEAGTYEILVGVTSRTESRQAAERFAAPNVYYRLAVEGQKLLIVNQGSRTGDAVYDDLEKRLNAMSAEQCDLNPGNLNVNGDIRFDVDRRMQERSEETDLRLLHQNVLYVAKADNGFSAQQRAELLADTYLAYLPDVITFNEALTGEPMDVALRKLLAQEYTFVPLSNPDSVNSNLQKGICGTPIAYRTAAGLSLLESNVITIDDSDAFHTVSWAIFRTGDGNLFLVLSAHLLENKENGEWTDKYTRMIVEELNRVRSEWGALPLLLNGDWFFWEEPGVAPYHYLIAQGFADAGSVAQKAYSSGMGSFHKVGSGQVNTEEDLIFVTPEWFTVLAHKLLLDYQTINGSDHLPVLADVRFHSPATENDIPEFWDPSLPPLPENHLGVGAGGEIGVPFDSFGCKDQTIPAGTEQED